MAPAISIPKYFPPDKLPGVLRREDTLMRQMDLHVFGIMDFSEGDHAVGNADLPKRVVDAYYQNMPAADGFLNGYGPANTYDCRDGRPLLSYNYYVEVRKSEEEVAEDLRELARINPQRPYFLPVHVREDNNVQRMKTIMDRLGPDFEVVPPREFMIMAGKATDHDRALPRPATRSFRSLETRRGSKQKRLPDDAMSWRSTTGRT